MKDEIEYLPPQDLRPYKRNARTHSKTQIRQIADSMEEFGFTSPILIDENSMILAGHGRARAAILLGMQTVPCIRKVSLNELQKRAYILADNKLALNARWDEDLLARELADLQALVGPEIGLGVIGFSEAELDQLIDGLEPEEPGNPTDDIIPKKVPRRCAPGDLWQLGPNRLICGDALDPKVVSHLMSDERARMVFSDPPYNVPIDGHVGNSGKIQHREFAMAAGEMTPPQFITFLSDAMRNLRDYSVDGSIHFLCMDWRHMAEMMAAGDAVYDSLKNLIVWVKDNGGMGTFYRSRHELIFAFKNGTAAHVNTFELGQHGRYRTNVWQYRGVNTRKAGRMEELALHPTVKPVQMIVDAIRDVSARGDIVLDLFGGSGSTLIAAAKTGRRAYVCELDPLYCDTIIARWEAFAGDRAEHVVCGWPRSAA